jgi:hypothetical protein
MTDADLYPHLVLVGLAGVDPSLIAQGEAFAAQFFSVRGIDPHAAWKAYNEHRDELGSPGGNREQKVLATMFHMTQAQAIEHALDPGPARSRNAPVEVPIQAALEVHMRNEPQVSPAGLEVLGYVTVDHGMVIQTH